MAFAYHYASVRTTSRLAGKGQKAFPMLSVAGFLLRLTALGVLFLIMALWLKPHVNLVVTVLAFIAAFTGVTGYSLYRFAVAPRSGGKSTSPTS